MVMIAESELKGLFVMRMDRREQDAALGSESIPEVPWPPTVELLLLPEGWT